MPLSPCDPAPTTEPPGSPGQGTAAFTLEQESHRRAMPVQRLLGSGMRWDDALAIHAMSSERVGWDRAAEWLGERNVREAKAARTPVGRRAFFRFASACYRVGQAALPADTDRKRALHAMMVEAFGRAAALDEPPTEKVEIAWRGGRLCGWLARPAGVQAPAVVIIMGGFDGWREEYWPGAQHLVERGLAAFLADGPGQGETRLKHELYLDADVHLAFSAMADHLIADKRVGNTVGIWGNSLGGCLAARTAAADPRFGAVCVNSGTVRPMELPERFPRFWAKVEALVGTADRRIARQVLQALDITQMVVSIACPVLQLHGVPDQVFLLENARAICDEAGSGDKTLLIWDDGDHCIYNHSDEKNIIVADWFASRLR